MPTDEATTYTEARRPEEPAPKTTRRKLLGGAALASGALAIDAAVRAAPARAADGDPVILGQLNSESHPTIITNTNTQSLAQENTGLEVSAGGPVGVGIIATGGSVGGPGVQGFPGTPSEAGVVGIGTTGIGTQGQSTTGIAVFADSTDGGIGVLGTIENGGVGVRAEGGGDGKALEVDGVATFSRSGIAFVPTGSFQVTVTGVPIRQKPDSTILAFVQLARNQISLARRIWATAALPVLGANEFTLYLNREAPSPIRVAWFVLG
jgi:hypothetical protein